MKYCIFILGLMIQGCSTERTLVTHQMYNQTGKYDTTNTFVPYDSFVISQKFVGINKQQWPIKEKQGEKITLKDGMVMWDLEDVIVMRYGKHSNESYIVYTDKELRFTIDTLYRTPHINYCFPVIINKLFIDQDHILISFGNQVGMGKLNENLNFEFEDDGLTIIISDTIHFITKHSKTEYFPCESK